MRDERAVPQKCHNKNEHSHLMHIQRNLSKTGAISVETGSFVQLMSDANDRKETSENVPSMYLFASLVHQGVNKNKVDP